MASSDARPVPIKNTAYRCVFPILDADGDLVTGAAGLDSEVSKDQGAFADCTNEATEIATSSGMYYLDLTATEMNADCVAVIVKTSTTGAKTTPIILYPQEAGDIKVDIETAAGTAWGSGAITAASIATDAIGASELAADAVAEIADAIWDEARAGHVAAGSFGEGVASVQGNVTGSVASVTGNVGGNVAGSVGSVTGAVGSVAGNVGGNVTGSVGSLAAQAKADVNAEVVDCLNVDTYAEPTSAPAATSTLRAKLGWIFKLLRNKRTQTATTETLYADDGTTPDSTSTKSDDATTFTRGEWS